MIPDWAVIPLSRGLGAAVEVVHPRRELVARNMQRAHGGALRGPARRQACRAAFASYIRYWLESLGLPWASATQIDSRFSIDGLQNLRAAIDNGCGAVLALPHVGSWEVGGGWLVRQGFPLTVVAEVLQPPELFAWFRDLRRGMGVSVVPLDGDAGTAVLRTLRSNQAVALLCDRDLEGGGIEVEFFGERTTLPGGPATLALRTGAALLPTAVYFEGDGHRALIDAPVPAARQDKLRDDVARITQDLARRLEALITRAPEQWHLFQPNWPSDRFSCLTCNLTRQDPTR